MKRGKLLGRGKGLERRQGLATVTPLQSRAGLQQGGQLQPGGQLARTSRISPVSARRRKVNQARTAMADQLWPDRRDGTVMCGCGRPECHRPADDLHELLPRGRGGSITDPENVVPLARECHQEIQLGPDWAYASGLLKHDGLCCQGRAICVRYAPEEDADAC